MTIRKTAASDQPGLVVEGQGGLEKTAAGNWQETDEEALAEESAADDNSGR